MEKRRSPQYLSEELAAKRRLDAIRAAVGMSMGAAAGAASAVLTQPYSGILQALLLAAGFVGAELYARRLRVRSLARGILAYLSAYLLGLFSFYAALIR